MAHIDPLWAILSVPGKRFGQWELDEFLRTGEEEISSLLQSAESLGLPKRRECAVDFGCGVGRLTRALRPRFRQCHGVDISRHMLEMARRLAPDCDFREGHDLSSFPTGQVDFLYSSMVLQHQPDSHRAARLIADMVRVLAPGGLLIFQMPIHLPVHNRLQLRRRTYRLLRSLGVGHAFVYRKLKLCPIRMVALPEERARKIVEQGGAAVLRVDRSTRFSEPWVSGIYYCSK